MERLTWHNGEYWTQVQDVNIGYKNVCAKLAAYENTGLEPEEIKSLQAEWNVNRNALDYYLKSEHEGRLVVLPCAVGDIVYYKTYKENATICVGVQPHTVHSIRTYCIVEGEYANVGLPADQFGKTVFLTRYEAEKALEE